MLTKLIVRYIIDIIYVLYIILYIYILYMFYHVCNIFSSVEIILISEGTISLGSG